MIVSGGMKLEKICYDSPFFTFTAQSIKESLEVARITMKICLDYFLNVFFFGASEEDQNISKIQSENCGHSWRTSKEYFDTKVWVLK